MKIRFLSLTVCGLIGLLVLAGCQGRETSFPTYGVTATEFSPRLTQTGPVPPTSRIETAYPGPSGMAETVYPQPVYPTQAIYPAPSEGVSAYPGATEQIQQAYPGPTEPALEAYPNPTQPVVAYPGPTQSINLVPTIQTSTAEPSLPFATATATSQSIPTNTSLPTSTPVPTITPTPALPPPIRDELVASAPDQFQQDSGRVQLVEFFAYWCVTCRSMAPTIHSLEALYSGRVNFVYLDIDDPANVQHERDLGYRYQPHFFLLGEDGKILRQWIGWVTSEELRNAIDASLR